MFIDHVIIDVEAGAGGNGCISFRREKFVPRGGPDGGDGGRGGHVIFRASSRITTLIDLQYQKHYRAGNGSHGQGQKKRGRDGGDVVIDVPPGTVVKDAESGEVICELLEEGESRRVAEGGAGGRGNDRFKSSRNRAPRKATPGKAGCRATLELTLKLIADVGLVGEPNAGKSTLLSTLSSAHPKVADYPFTTKTPVLGIVKSGEYDSFVMVDIPGLIEGAHRGRGMGKEFLRHVERCRVILYLVDVSSDDPVQSYETIKNELLRYDPLLLEKPSLLALTKCDLLMDGASSVEKSLLDIHDAVCPISSVSGDGLNELKRKLKDILS